MKGIKKLVNDILIKYNFDIDYNDVVYMFEKKYPNRYYHTLENHIIPMIDTITKDYEDGSFLYVTLYDYDAKISASDKKLNDKIYDSLILSTIFHDIVYDPKSVVNEIMSVEYMRNHITEKTDEKIIDDVEDMIFATMSHDLTDNRFDENTLLFLEYDLKILTKSFFDLLEWEKQIQKEYGFIKWETYKKERIKILNKLNTNNNENLIRLIYYIESYTPKIAIYAGSFNPFHIGHMDILKKSEQIFDKVIVAKGYNKKKNSDLKEWEDKYKELVELLPQNEVVKYEGLLTDLIKEQKDADITLIRGLRNGYDLDAENTLTTFMKDMYPELKIVYISSNKDLEHISSSAIREISSYNPKLVEKYLPKRFGL